MENFDQEIKQIQANNPSEINGELGNYFSVITRANGSYKVIWGKPVSTHIRHKVEALVKKHFIPAIK
jgi:hypothetical protein